MVCLSRPPRYSHSQWLLFVCVPDRISVCISLGYVQNMPTLCKTKVLGHFCSFSLMTFAGCHFTPPYGGIFGKRKKRAFQACMGHGGVGLRQKKLFNVDCRRVRDFPPILSRPARIFTRFESYFQPYFQVFNPEPF